MDDLFIDENDTWNIVLITIAKNITDRIFSQVGSFKENGRNIKETNIKIRKRHLKSSGKCDEEREGLGNFSTLMPVNPI